MQGRIGIRASHAEFPYGHAYERLRTDEPVSGVFEHAIDDLLDVLQQEALFLLLVERKYVAAHRNL